MRREKGTTAEKAERRLERPTSEGRRRRRREILRDSSADATRGHVATAAKPAVVSTPAIFCMGFARKPESYEVLQSSISNKTYPASKVSEFAAKSLPYKLKRDEPTAASGILY